jgi:hypothetical protein
MPTLLSWSIENIDWPMIIWCVCGLNMYGKEHIVAAVYNKLLYDVQH